MLYLSILDCLIKREEALIFVWLPGCLKFVIVYICDLPGYLKIVYVYFLLYKEFHKDPYDIILHFFYCREGKLENCF
jgi:hypothetical protein